MKRIFMLLILLTMIVSLGGCLWGFEGRGRDGGHDERGGGHGTVRHDEVEKEVEATKNGVRNETEEGKPEQCLIVRGYS